MAEPVIELDGLTKHYGDVVGVEDLSFTVREGEIFGFLGPNGAGKSTAIRTLLGLLSPTEGGGRLFGSDVTDRRALRAVKRRLGYIPDDGAFYDRLTGERLLDYFADLKGDARRAELLERFPIPADRPVKEYSRGNRQKLAVVQAFMHEPDVLVMDEPTSGLDPLLQQEFYDLLEAERARGVTVLFSSHILPEVRRVCDRVCIVRDGRLVTIESIDDLLEKSGKVARVDLAESPPTEALSFDGVGRITREDDGTYTLVVTGNYDALVDGLAEYTVRDLEIRESSLEDVFMHFYGGEAFSGEEAIERAEVADADV
ncbi:ABC transporter ATP-binding protein [Natronomonas marina]|uniref:ABC transporter ATP-binding protein n=1 Tax=Natronomonas marina TaxID=2961939 RepID=UPI0020C9FC0B|nr:ABC transporter ATP-binding protein [Natronomonas marina]